MGYYTTNKHQRKEVFKKNYDFRSFFANPYQKCSAFWAGRWAEGPPENEKRHTAGCPGILPIANIFARGSRKRALIALFAKCEPEHMRLREFRLWRIFARPAACERAPRRLWRRMRTRIQSAARFGREMSGWITKTKKDTHLSVLRFGDPSTLISELRSK